MKTAFIFLLIGTIIVLVAWSRLPMIIGTNTVDIHVHDTKVVIGFAQIILLILLFLGTLFFLGGVIETGFKQKRFTIPLAIFFLIDILCTVEVIKIIRHIYS